MTTRVNSRRTGLTTSHSVQLYLAQAVVNQREKMGNWSRCSGLVGFRKQRYEARSEARLLFLSKSSPPLQIVMTSQSVQFTIRSVSSNLEHGFTRAIRRLS